MNPVELVVGEGLLDARAAGKILRILGVPFDPARCIDVNLARDSRSRQVREDPVPETGTTAPVGKNYTRAMEKFIDTHWEPLEASRCSPSLARAIRTIQSATSL